MQRWYYFIFGQLVLLIDACGLYLVAMASLAVEHGLCCPWHVNLPRTGTEPMVFPALADGFREVLMQQFLNSWEEEAGLKSWGYHD